MKFKFLLSVTLMTDIETSLQYSLLMYIAEIRISIINKNKKQNEIFVFKPKNNAEDADVARSSYGK